MIPIPRFFHKHYDFFFFCSLPFYYSLWYFFSFPCFIVNGRSYKIIRIRLWYQKKICVISTEPAKWKKLRFSPVFLSGFDIFLNSKREWGFNLSTVVIRRFEISNSNHQSSNNKFMLIRKLIRIKGNLKSNLNSPSFTIIQLKESMLYMWGN